MKNQILALYIAASTLMVLFGSSTAQAQGSINKEAIWKEIAPFFEPPAAYANEFGPYASVLVDGQGKAIQHKKNGKNSGEQSATNG